MKHSLRAGVAALALCIAGSVQAASIGGDDIIVNILRNGVSGESMLINTGLSATDVGSGTTTSWSSDDLSGLTAAINSFISGASSVSFWVAGSYVSGTDTYALSDVVITDGQVINSFDQSLLPAFVDAANIDAGFVAATDPWLAGIPSTSDIHYTEPNLYGNGLVGGIALGSSAAFIRSGFGFFSGVTQQSLESWSLAADGTLSYGAVSAVPVPAAVWLFGSGLLGLVGVARRRKV